MLGGDAPSGDPGERVVHERVEDGHRGDFVFFNEIHIPTIAKPKKIPPQTWRTHRYSWSLFVSDAHQCRQSRYADQAF